MEWLARRPGMSSMPWRMKAARADPGSVSEVDPLAGPLPPVSRLEASPLRQSGTGEQFAGHSPLLRFVGPAGFRPNTREDRDASLFHRRGRGYQSRGL